MKTVSVITSPTLFIIEPKIDYTKVYEMIDGYREKLNNHNRELSEIEKNILKK